MSKNCCDAFVRKAYKWEPLAQELNAPTISSSVTSPKIFFLNLEDLLSVDEVESFIDAFAHRSVVFKALLVVGSLAK
jgi:hypothetical protein